MSANAGVAAVAVEARPLRLRRLYAVVVCGVSARLPSAEARAWQGDADEPERDGTAQVSIGAVRQRILTPSEARALRRRRLRRPDALMRHQARDADTRHVARSGVLDQRVFSLV